MLKTGEKAPDFNLPDGEGELFHLSEALKKNTIVLYFYPKDDTRGCTAEACAFRDLYDVFKEAGAEVVGVSADKAASHQKFSSKYNLPFLLLTDSDNTVRKLYRVPKTLGLIPGRVTFVIDREGIIQYAFNSLNKPLEHVNSALQVIKKLK